MKNKTEELKYFEKRNKEKGIKGNSTYPELGILLFAEVGEFISSAHGERKINGKYYPCDYVSSREINNALDLNSYSFKNHEGKQIEKDPSIKKRNVQRTYFPDFYAISDGQMLFGTVGPEKDFEIWFTSDCIAPTLPLNLDNTQRLLFLSVWLAHELMIYMKKHNYNLCIPNGKTRKDDFNSFLVSRKGMRDFIVLTEDFKNRYQIKDKTFSRCLKQVSMVLEAFSKYNFS